MPKTLPGFLMVAGLLMFVGSLFIGKLKYKGIELPALPKGARITIRILGIIFMIASALLYAFISPKEIPVLAPPAPP